VRRPCLLVIVVGCGCRLIWWLEPLPPGGAFIVDDGCQLRGRDTAPARRARRDSSALHRLVHLDRRCLWRSTFEARARGSGGRDDVEGAPDALSLDVVRPRRGVLRQMIPTEFHSASCHPFVLVGPTLDQTDAHVLRGAALHD